MMVMPDREPWAVYDPYNGGLDYFPTEDDALASATERIQDYLADEEWDEDVEQVAVLRQHYGTSRIVVGVKAAMDPDEWDVLTGGNTSADEWWDFVLVSAEDTDA